MEHATFIPTSPVLWARMLSFSRAQVESIQPGPYRDAVLKRLDWANEHWNAHDTTSALGCYNGACDFYQIAPKVKNS